MTKNQIVPGIILTMIAVHHSATAWFAPSSNYSPSLPHLHIHGCVTNLEVISHHQVQPGLAIIMCGTNLSELATSPTEFYRFKVPTGYSNRIPIIVDEPMGKSLFFRMVELPGDAAPVMCLPTKATANSVEARWQAVDWAKGYRIDVSTNDLFSCFTVMGADTGNTTHYVVSNLMANTTYYYRIIPYAGYIRGEYSLPLSIVTSNVMENSMPNPEMVLIPAGSFAMGDAIGEGFWTERPIHLVYLSEYYIGRHEVSKGLWDKVFSWAVDHGYEFTNQGMGKGSNHPVHSVSWYDTVKWCNALSEMTGLTPAYYIDTNHITTYKTGLVDVLNSFVKWEFGGYRLPTEAEWEKAARGGVHGKRFPWGDTITHNEANYFSVSRYEYDLSPTRNYHPLYVAMDYDKPFTSPVGSFPENHYGLYDFGGNLREMCWDWHQDNWYMLDEATSPNPQGPPIGNNRILRGGHYATTAEYLRCSIRLGFTVRYWLNGSKEDGFRIVRKQAQ
jgi:formylglycine-generating enzyme